MSWLQISFEIAPESAQAFSSLLSDAGALAVTLQDAGDDPVLEPAPGTTPLWSTTRVVGLFPPDTNAAATLSQLRRLGAGPALPPHRIEHLQDQPWARRCRDEFQARRFGKRLWVCPSWTDPPRGEAVSIRLDPGLAFGTGSHPTTALCLEWLEGLSLAGRQLIDYGCGSGILAIAALKLGASRVWAVDTDPQALQATHRNAAENGVDNRLVIAAPENFRGATAEILVANILANPLVDLASRFAGYLTPGAQIGVSGLLAEQANLVSDRYRPWFALGQPVYRDDWCLLTGRRLAGEPA